MNICQSSTASRMNLMRTMVYEGVRGASDKREGDQ